MTNISNQDKGFNHLIQAGPYHNLNNTNDYQEISLPYECTLLPSFHHTSDEGIGARYVLKYTNNVYIIKIKTKRIIDLFG